MLVRAAMSTCVALLIHLCLLSATAIASYNVVDWNAFNASIGNRLVAAAPFARPCFQNSTASSGTFDPTTCSSIEENYLNHTAITDQLGGYINTQWQSCQRTGEQCLLDSTDPSNPAAFSPPKVCSQGSVPSFGVSVQSADDVISSFKFAKANNITVVVKNTGHDYKGRSTAPGSLAIWTHNLKMIELDRSFRARQCNDTSPLSAVTIGAGVQYTELIDFADLHNITVPSGGDLSVGAAGGYLQGGGHSILSPSLGLAVDRALEFEVVTPTGRHVIANACQHPDLFFSLRGGSPGTFGVVLKATIRVFSSMKINAAYASFDGAVNGNAHKFTQYVTDHALDLSREGWGYYAIPAAEAVFANVALNATRSAESLSGFKTFVQESLGGEFTMTEEPAYKSFFDKYIEALVHVPVGMPMTTTSRLVPADKLRNADDRAALVGALDVMNNETDLFLMFATTPINFESEEGENATSVTPAWRDAIWHAAGASLWNYNTSTSEVAQRYASLSKATDPLRALTPGSGAYQNEADMYEPDFEESFWGRNYVRLLEIKKKYDPDHLLDCWQCVGWKGASNPRYDCVVTD